MNPSESGTRARAMSMSIPSEAMKAAPTRRRSLGRFLLSQAASKLSTIKLNSIANRNNNNNTFYDNQVCPWKEDATPYKEPTEPPLPDLIGESEILTLEHRKTLARYLPARAEGYSWTLIYSTSKHGFSLKTLYRNCIGYENPALLVIQDTDGTVFGALTSSPLRTSDRFYGTGESFLFSFHPEFGRYGWTGVNDHFIKGDTESLAIGAGDGCFGLWLDGDLYHGTSNPCLTFGNPRLSKKHDFVVKTLECWGFV